MKTMLKVLFLYLLLSTCSSSLLAQADSIKYKIVIHKTSAPINSEVFVEITQDSLLVMLVDTTHHIQVSQKSRAKITSLVLSLDLNKLEEIYWNKKSRDKSICIFDITIGNQKKFISVYHQKVIVLYELIKEINQVLPKQFSIGYDKSYFDN